jgi:hypothetical protein
MTRIDPHAQVLLLLRERLERTARTEASGPTTSAAQNRLAALAMLRDLPERSFRRAMLRGMMAERVGDTLASDPQFEEVIGRVLDLLEGNPETADLLARATAALRSGPA